MNTIRHSRDRKRGQSLVEYGLIIGLSVILIILSVGVLAPAMADTFSDINAGINSAIGVVSPTPTAAPTDVPTPTAPAGPLAPIDAPPTAVPTATAGPLASIAISPSTASIAAGSTQTYAATGFDAYGNNLGDVTSNTTFSIGGSPSATCSANACGSPVAFSYTVTGTDAGLTNTATLDVTAGPLASIFIDPWTASITAGSTQTYAATGFDANSNNLGDVTGSTTFSIDGGGTCSANACGSTVAGSYTVTATDAGLTDAATLDVTAGDAYKLAFSQQPTNTVAGVNFSPAVTVTVQDIYGNTVITNDINVILNIGTNPGGGTLWGTGNLAPVNGVVTFSNNTITSVGSGYTLTASSPRLGVIGATSNPFNIVPGAISRIAISPETASIVAGSTQTYTATSLDTWGNNLGDVTSNTTFSIGYGGHGTCSANACGDTVTGSHTVTATYAGLTKLADLNVTAGPLAAIFISPGTASIVAGSTQTYTATGHDAYGSNTGDVTGNTTFSISGSGTCSANACGSTVAGSYTVTATNAGLTNTATLSVTAGAIDHFSMTSASRTAGFAFSVSITAKDIYGNTATSYSGPKCIAYSGPGNAPSGIAPLYPARSSCAVGQSAVTFMSGVASTGSVTLYNAISTVITATDAASGKSGSSAAFTVSPAAANKLSFTQSPGNTTAGATISPAVTVTVQDAYGNKVTTSNVSITVAIGTNPGGGTLSGTKTRSAVAGVATLSGLSINYAGNGYTLTATSGTLTAATSSSFNIT